MKTTENSSFGYDCLMHFLFRMV